MTDFDRDRVLARVRKMLALANDQQASEGERDNALRMAHATLAKYNLELSDTQAKDDPRGKHEAVYYSRPWSRSCSAAIAELFFCKYVFVQPRRTQDGKHYFIGKGTNATTALEMARFIVGSIDKEATRWQRANGGNHDSWRAFCWGATMAITKRVKELQASKDQASAPGTALVLANLYQVEAAANEAFLRATMNTTKGRNAPGTRDYGASAAGRSYGNSVSLSTQVGGASGTAKLLR